MKHWIEFIGIVFVLHGFQVFVINPWIKWEAPDGKAFWLYDFAPFFCGMAAGILLFK
jgi:hypothetical protein